MGKQYEKKITWVIKDFSSLQSNQIYSDQFVVGSCKWRLMASSKGDTANYNSCFSLFLNVPDSESLPFGWKRHTKFGLTVVNQLSEELSQMRGSQNWFDKQAFGWGYSEMLPLAKLLEKNGGFLVNGEVKIVAEVDVLELIGKSDVLEETSSVMETMDVNGIQVLPSQMEFVSRLFEKHPDIALVFRSKNPHLRTGYIDVLLSLTQKLGQSPQELSNDDLSDAGIALTYMTEAGFKIDWLETTLEEIKEKKKREEACLARLHVKEEELKSLKQKCLELEAQVDKEKAELLEARAPFSFDQYLSS